MCNAKGGTKEILKKIRNKHNNEKKKEKGKKTGAEEVVEDLNSQKSNVEQQRLIGYPHSYSNPSIPTYFIQGFPQSYEFNSQNTPSGYNVSQNGQFYPQTTGQFNPQTFGYLGQNLSTGFPIQNLSTGLTGQNIPQDSIIQKNSQISMNQNGQTNI